MLDPVMMKCSRIGPMAKPGKNVSAPTMTTTPMTSRMNVGPTTGKLPTLIGAVFFFASAPARARIGTISK